MRRREHDRVRAWSLIAALLMMAPAVAAPVADKQASIISSLPDTFPNASISDNLLPRSINIRATGGIAATLGGGYYLAGLDVDNVPTLVSLDETGVLRWSSSIGTSSPLNEVLAVAIDASGNPYMAGRLGKDLITVVQTDLLANGTDLESVKKAGAFVSAFTSTGTGLWTATVGNVAAGDCFHALAQGRSGTMYAGGRVGSTSPIFSGSSSEDVNVLRPMLAKLSNTDGSMEFLLKPEPVKGGEEEYITTLAVDTSDDSLVYAGGKQEKDRGTVYKFNDKDIVASYRLKDSGPVAAISASSSTSGRFATVGGCYLNRLDSRGTTFIEFPTKIEADGKCIGEPQGIAHRDSLSEDGALMVLVQQSEGLKPELLLFLDKNGWLVGRAPGATSLTGPAHGPLLSGDSLGVVAGVDGSDTFVGGTDLTTQTGLLRKAEITAAETAESLRERNLFVIIAAAGGGAVVFVGGLVIVGIIVAYTKTTGDPA